MVTITTVYNGVSPEEIEKIITVPQENAIQTERNREHTSPHSEAVVLFQV